jgi:carbon-monoxide dehydrogenase medium subunit
VIPAPFDYVRATSADEATAALAEHGDEAKLLAGGHSLLPLMKLRLAAPSVLVDVGRLDDLRGVRQDGGEVVIGALTTHHDVARSEVLQRQVPLLAHVAGQVGDPQVRHRGTIGGSIAHADPASDLPAAVLALGGSFTATSTARGTRTIAATDFFTGFLESALEADELLTEIRVRCPAPAGRSRSSTAGPSTGRSSASPRWPATARAGSAWSTWGPRRCSPPACRRPGREAPRRPTPPPGSPRAPSPAPT